MRIIFFICILCIPIWLTQPDNLVPVYYPDTPELSVIAAPISQSLIPTPFITLNSYFLLDNLPIHKIYIVPCPLLQVRAPPASMVS